LKNVDLQNEDEHKELLLLCMLSKTHDHFK